MAFPPSLDELVGADHPVRVVHEVLEKIDITALLHQYKPAGSSSYHPWMLLKALVYAYINNIYSSRKIEGALKENIYFIWLTGMSKPDHNTINRFRGQRLHKTLQPIFTQVVLLLHSHPRNLEPTASGLGNVFSPQSLNHFPGQFPHGGSPGNGNVFKKIITKKSGWKFNWKSEAKMDDRIVYKLTIEGNRNILQGLVSFSDYQDHIFLHLVESAPFNFGKPKLYEGVPGNYEKTLGAHNIGGHRMAIGMKQYLYGPDQIRNIHR